MKIHPLAAALLFLLPTLSADEGKLFLRGILVLGESRLFSLSTEGGAQTAWVGMGETFAGHQLVSFDEKENKLTVRYEDREIPVFMAGTLSSTEAGETVSEAAELLRKMKFQEMVSKMIEDQREAMRNMIRRMMGDQVSEEMLEAQMKAMDAFNEAMDWEGFHEDVVRVYEETFTSEEIRGLINFYSTPAGEAFVEKQPELNRRMMEAVQPRIMAAMPRMQQSMMESMTRPTPPQPAPAP